MQEQMSVDGRAWRDNWQREIEGEYLYRSLSNVASDPTLKKALAQMAEQEGEHAAIWSSHMKAAGFNMQQPQPDLRIHLIALLGHWFGAERVLGLLIDDEVGDITTYVEQAEKSPDLDTYRRVLTDETSHARALAGLRNHDATERSEPWHRAGGVGGSLREVVYGFNDGLTANFGLVMGVVGASVNSRVILLAGFAGLLADALSMAASGFLAARSEQEVSEHQLALERAELRLMPEEERQEMTWHLRRKGLTAQEATVVADRLIQNPDTALTELAREELGIDPTAPQDPLREGIVTGIATGIGAIIPIIPFLVLNGVAAIWTGVVISMLAHFLVGMSRAIFTGRPAIRSGFEMFAVGMGVALVTYVLGQLFGVKL